MSLSERWAGQGRFFGTVRDDLDAFEASDLWRELAAWRQHVFVEVDRLPCATCAHYRACGGFWLADGSAATACTGWQAAFGLLTDAWRAHRDELAGEAEEAS